jgi:hypothetical protein
MDIETLRHALLFCAIANYAILMLWFVAFVFFHDAIHRLHARWFRLTPERFDLVSYAGMAAYKIGVLLFNLVPWLALTWLGRAAG